MTRPADDLESYWSAIVPMRPAITEANSVLDEPTAGSAETGDADDLWHFIDHAVTTEECDHQLNPTDVWIARGRSSANEIVLTVRCSVCGRGGLVAFDVGSVVWAEER